MEPTNGIIQNTEIISINTESADYSCHDLKLQGHESNEDLHSQLAKVLSKLNALEKVPPPKVISFELSFDFINLFISRKFYFSRRHLQNAKQFFEFLLTS